jgi:DNA mismatch repair protein MutS
MAKSTAPYTPMMMQYLQIKAQHPDTLIFFRLGDFYELFFEDAKIAAKELSLVLTGKSAGQEERVPMCGIPYHAYKNYVQKLISRGYKVGMVEQLEPASQGKGLVARDVTQIYTPGSFIENDQVDHHFLAAIASDGVRYVILYGDISTGERYLDYVQFDPELLRAYLQKINCLEVVVSQAMASSLQSLLSQSGIFVSQQESLDFPLDGQPLAPLESEAYQRFMSYVQQTQKRPLHFFKPLVFLAQESIMKIDGYSLANLEILQSLSTHQFEGSLAWLLDETSTPMGSRLLKQWLMRPSAHRPTIELRLQFVERCLQDFLTLETLKQHLSEVFDIPRIIGKLHFLQVNARDLLSLKKSLQQMPMIKSLLQTLATPLSQMWLQAIPDFQEIVQLLNNSIHEDPPISIKEGGIIKPSFNPALTEWVQLAKGGKASLLALELSERQRTGIKNLKVGFNQVFGYYLEVSNGQLSAIQPEFGYERRQTLANGERFITKELKALESKLLQAEQAQTALEEKIFLEVVQALLPHTTALQTLADQLAAMDVLASFATVSSQYQYSKPMFVDERKMDIEKSRHPMMEKMNQKSSFVANDLRMEPHTDTLLITGPNMGGKSTFMRQIALLYIMAQVGCFVPAKQAQLMLIDAIFTRIGASDDLVGGQSTFMMEMSQTQFALANATSRSLLIFDEIGRGTATFDGMALAQAILEYATLTIRAKTLFSTHYHELTEVEKHLPTLKNIHVAVHEENDIITFLYQVKPGSMSQSFGIHVAQLASLPASLITRAKTLLASLEDQPKRTQVPPHQEEKVSEIEQKIRQLDPLKLSPLEALQLLIDLKKHQG